MELWQKVFLIAFAIINLAVFIKGYYECKYRKNAYGRILLLTPLGIFFWGDSIVFGLFWILVSKVAYLLNDWYLFLLIVSVFWIVRSLGETIYWFNQQFSKEVRNPPEKQLLYFVFQNDSVWFANQIIWQCVTVVSVIFTIYFAKSWLNFRF